MARGTEMVNISCNIRRSRANFLREDQLQREHRLQRHARSVHLRSAEYGIARGTEIVKFIACDLRRSHAKFLRGGGEKGGKGKEEELGEEHGEFEERIAGITGRAGAVQRVEPARFNEWVERAQFNGRACAVQRASVCSSTGQAGAVQRVKRAQFSGSSGRSSAGRAGAVQRAQAARSGRNGCGRNAGRAGAGGTSEFGESTAIMSGAGAVRRASSH
jgi:hypothetical protein